MKSFGPAPLWSPLPPASRAAAQHNDGDSPAVLSALHELLQDMRRLESRVERLSQSAAHNINTDSHLCSPLGSLKADAEALEAASRARFENLEGTLSAVSQAHATMMERLDSKEKRGGSEESPASEVNVSRSAEWGKASPKKELRDMPPLPEKKAALKPANASASLVDRIQTEPLTTVRSERLHRAAPYSVPSRSGGPNAKSRRKAAAPHEYFKLPGWATNIELQSEPLPEGQDFVKVVQAIKAVRSSSQIPHGHAIDNSDIVNKLKKSDPFIFKRHGVEKWKEFVPILQRYVAVFVVLPPLQRDLGRCRGEHTLILDLKRPYFARPANAPTFDQQIKAVCKQVNLRPEAWFQRGHAPPLERTPEPARGKRGYAPLPPAEASASVPAFTNRSRSPELKMRQ